MPLLLTVVCPSFGDLLPYDVTIDWNISTRTLDTVTTLQVVSNPILDRTFTSPNGTSFPNPIHETAWGSLRSLGADMVRFVPWYPYPHRSVAELNAPTSKGTSWSFELILPQLEDFMNATYSMNHSTVLNFATQPCWLFGDAHNQVQNCSFPSNPDQSDSDYVRGDRKNLIDGTASDLADYYARLLSYLVLGEFVDEHGVVHSGGPKYDKFNRANGHVWELFNEPDSEHNYNVSQYTHDYDVVVPRMAQAVGGADHAPEFMGLGKHLQWAEWAGPFLNASTHNNPSQLPPIDYISLHFYVWGANRQNTSAYSETFFDGQYGASGMVADAIEILRLRDASSMPGVRVDFNEIGIELDGDNDPEVSGTDGNIPDVFWNAAGAQFAFIFASLAPHGVSVLGSSQLVGSPMIPGTRWY
jgi:hypothetical protein